MSRDIFQNGTFRIQDLRLFTQRPNNCHIFYFISKTLWRLIKQVKWCFNALLLIMNAKKWYCTLHTCVKLKKKQIHEKVIIKILKKMRKFLVNIQCKSLLLPIYPYNPKTMCLISNLIIVIFFLWTYTVVVFYWLGTHKNVP